LVADSIASLIQTRDTEEYSAVTELAKQQGQFKPLFAFSRVARELQNRDS
jgi:hypothetical protein